METAASGVGAATVTSLQEDSGRSDESDDESIDDRLNKQDDLGETALHHGIQNYESKGEFKGLLKHGANPSIADLAGRTPLLEAAACGETNSADLLRDCAAYLCAVERKGRNAMHLAAHHGQARFKDLLNIKLEAIMLAKDNDGATLLDVAIQLREVGRFGVNSLLDGYKDEVAEKMGNLCLHWFLRMLCSALYENDTIVVPIGTLKVEHILSLVTMFVSEKSNPIATVDEMGALPIHTACRNSKVPIEVIQFLVEQGPATVCHEDNQGNLPIHTLCASQPALDTVKFLLSKGEAGITMTNHENSTPFVVAALSSASVDVLWYLIKVNPALAVASLRCTSAAKGVHEKCTDQSAHWKETTDGKRAGSEIATAAVAQKRPRCESPHHE
jgi:ankyrin repeat protein